MTNFNNPAFLNNACARPAQPNEEETQEVVNTDGQEQPENGDGQEG